MTTMDREPDYIVLRFDPSMTRVPSLDGAWFDRNNFPIGTPDVPPERLVAAGVARPTNQFEVRDDGAVAEVWLVTAS